MPGMTSRFLTDIELLMLPHREHWTCDAPLGYIKATLHCGLVHVSCAELLPAEYSDIVSATLHWQWHGSMKNCFRIRFCAVYNLNSYLHSSSLALFHRIVHSAHSALPAYCISKQIRQKALQYAAKYYRQLQLPCIQACSNCIPVEKEAKLCSLHKLYCPVAQLHFHNRCLEIESVDSVQTSASNKAVLDWTGGL